MEALPATVAMPPGAFACQFIRQAFCFTYICNGHAMEHQVGLEPPTCTLMGHEKKRWADAREYCRSRQGALQTSSVDRVELFKANGVTSLWSGYFTQNGHVLKETPSTPTRANFHLFQWKFSPSLTFEDKNKCARFTLEPDQFPRTQTRKRRFLSEQRPQQEASRDRFLLEWADCEEERDFVCKIPARPLASLEVTPSKMFGFDESLDLQMFFTSRSINSKNSAFFCKRGHRNGQVFSISTPADRAVLKFVTQHVKRFSAQLGISDTEYQTSLFWVDDDHTPGCDALFLHASDDRTSTSGLIMSWRCGARLRVLCKAEPAVE
ncbi:hypothetical protein ElyMa_006456500, partial [Elysia marginata]